MSYVPENLDRWSSTDPATGTGGNYAGECYPDYYVAMFHHRDSDLLTESNWNAAWRRLEPLSGDDDSVIIIRTGHWAVGWTETMLIHESNEAALKEADAIRDALDSYCALDENDWSEREMEEANRVWRECYNWRERIDYIRRHASQFEFHDYHDMIGCVRGEYFAGYASELIN